MKVHVYAMVKSLNYPETRIFSAFLEENLSSRAVEPSRRLLDLAMDKEHPGGRINALN